MKLYSFATIACFLGRFGKNLRRMKKKWLKYGADGWFLGPALQHTGSPVHFLELINGHG